MPLPFRSINILGASSFAWACSHGVGSTRKRQSLVEGRKSCDLAPTVKTLRYPIAMFPSVAEAYQAEVAFDCTPHCLESVLGFFVLDDGKALKQDGNQGLQVLVPLPEPLEKLFHFLLAKKPLQTFWQIVQGNEIFDSILWPNIIPFLRRCRGGNGSLRIPGFGISILRPGAGSRKRPLLCLFLRCKPNIRG